MRILLCALGAIIASLLTACGSGSGTTTPASIRVVNALFDSTSPSITFSLNGAYALTQPNNSSSNYESITPGTYTASVAGASAGLTAGPSQTLGLGTGQNYTTLAYGRDKVVYAATITDNLATPATGYSTLDIANVAPDAGSLDVYLLPSGGTPVLGGATFQSVQGLSTAATIFSGSYDVVVTAAGSPSDVRIRIAGQAFTGAQAYTLGLTSTTGGALVNAVLIPQGVTTASSFSFVPASQARVRVMSALPQTGQVGVSVAGTALPVDFSPAPTKYNLVAAGSVITAVNVTDTNANTTVAATIPTIPGTAATFLAGNDYTVLVYGTNASPVATVLVDSNQVITNLASIRVVNGAVNGAAGVTLAVGTDTVSQVQYGTTSSYSGVSPQSSASFQLNGANGYNGGGSTVSHDLVTGAVYTVFVYDSTKAPYITQDR